MSTTMRKPLDPRLSSRRGKAKTYHPQVEPLEDRRLPSGLNYLTAPVLPTIDAAAQAHLRAILLQGERLGNQPSVFMRVGDSNTQTHFFLTYLGFPSYDYTDPALAGRH